MEITIPDENTILHHLDTRETSHHYTTLEIDSAKKIQRWWNGVKNKKIFGAIKYGIFAAEHSVTHEILRKLSPKEAELLQDPALNAIVRFRLGGSQFPPIVMFKIFISSQTVRYISGKNMIRPTSEASEDARRQMGNRKYFDQMLYDACQHNQLQVTDVIDITTVKDYMKYRTGIDESPAYLGGRENYWRKLTLDVLPRYTMMYSIVEFLSGTRSPQSLSFHKLQGLSRPQTQQVHRIKSVSSMSIGKSSPVTKPHSQDKVKTDSRERRTRLAHERANKMRRSYTLQTNEQGSLEQTDSGSPEPVPESHISGHEDINDDEAMELYQWTQELSFDELK